MSDIRDLISLRKYRDDLRKEFKDFINDWYRSKSEIVIWKPMAENNNDRLYIEWLENKMHGIIQSVD